MSLSDAMALADGPYDLLLAVFAAIEEESTQEVVANQQPPAWETPVTKVGR